MSDHAIDTQGREWVRWTTLESPDLKQWLHAPEPGVSSLILFSDNPEGEK